MKYLRNRLVDEFFDRTEVKATQHKKIMFTIALIPALLFFSYIFSIYDTLETPILIFFGFGIIAIYLVSLGATILAIDCWVISEMISPSVYGRYKNLKTFVKVIMDSPTRRQVLRVTRLYNDVLEKNGFENYLDTSNFINNVYDRLDKQDNKIQKLENEKEKIKTDYKRAFEIQNIKYDQSERRRIHAESETVRERVLKEEAQKELQKYKDKESEKIQEIDDKAHTKKITENSSLSNEDKFNEDL